MEKKLLIGSVFIFVVGVGGVTPIIAQTDVAPCYQVSKPILGTRCYQRVSVESRHVAYGEGISRGESSSTSILGWVVTGWNGPISASGNNASANIEFIESTTNLQIINNLDEYDKYLLNSRDKIQSYANLPTDSGVPVTVGGLIEKISQTLQENQIRRKYFYQAKTNVDRVVIRAEAAGRCTRKIFGQCVDNAGGWYRGYVDVYMVYVGSPSEISSSWQMIKSEIQQGLQLLEQARNNAR